jgi:hypothetical protein
MASKKSTKKTTKAVVVSSRAAVEPVSVDVLALIPEEDV